jgi:hypothetical protein
MSEEAAIIIYLAAAALWVIVWWRGNGFAYLRRDPLMWLPFLLCPAYLLANAAIVAVFGDIGDVKYEESRFVFIGERAQIAVSATSSVLIVATIVYGLTVKQLPVDFIRFMAYAFVAILGVMAPILWIPLETPAMFYVLRHFQTAALLYGLFLCVAGIVVLLGDLIRVGGAKVTADAAIDTEHAAAQTPGESTPDGGRDQE